MTRTPSRPSLSRRALGSRVLLPSAVALLALGACSSDPSEPSSAPTTSAVPLPDTASPTPTPTPPPGETVGGDAAAVPEGCAATGGVEVQDADTLQVALEDAEPGQVIRLADGMYEGNFVATTQATPDAPILLCGSRDAVLDGGDIDGDYALHLQGASSWHLLGFTVTGGKKGVMVDAGTGHRIEGLLVTSMGDEAIHLRTNSSDNVVAGNTVRDTGLRKPKYGEGIYVGSAESNWCRQTDCEPDRSDRNLIVGNDIAGTTAEAVDIKEGTTGGVLRGNTFDGSAMVEADSWVDIKGNDWRIEGNSGITSPTDGFQVHDVADGWGRGNVFSGNRAAGISELAINAAGNRELRASTTVGCDNTGDGGTALSNVPCSDI
ncbi:right-handed parallel beta-helix repeat-containing protein [Blastococcus goldschmidtiae]|uniref:Right-handed parallel beta-helix repeat-containing protein n=1 Tax=Blastococcus goldschmidtiae TaxID=3075546 RepID=A0ABU2KAY4_9ACTN|nr:right-handed parallel beta-helix repeat-containing protein [Blastococcus sp. DSM 46792]MDT0277359.1 right-handed parallel beta-helix repeat-containing protein [Blastococcus sp. DSM 46792]